MTISVYMPIGAALIYVLACKWVCGHKKLIRMYQHASVCIVI